VRGSRGEQQNRTTSPRLRDLALALALAALLPSAAAGHTFSRSQSGWQERAPLPLARSEVAAAATRSEIFVVGGLPADGKNSGRVDVYAPSADRWRRGPDLPIQVDHAMGTASNGRLYVVGGYDSSHRPVSDAFVLDRNRWRRLPPLPEGRAAGGIAIVGRKLYVVGGIRPIGDAGAIGLADRMLVLDLRRRRWSRTSGPTPREHLGVTALGGRIYAVAGRTAGFDSNLDTVESYLPSARRWRKLRPVPQPRGGTGAAAAGGSVVSVGGEAVAGTIASVFAYEPRERSWRRLPDLPTPRHGLAVASIGSRIFAIGGGPQPGLSASDANESLSLK
jgi:N-acetylneuraminic acid mutarotase